MSSIFQGLDPLPVGLSHCQRAFHAPDSGPPGAARATAGRPKNFVQRGRGAVAGGGPRGGLGGLGKPMENDT